MSKLPETGFAWMGRVVLERLLTTFPNAGERSTALSIYAAVALLAAKQHRVDQHGVQATRRLLATTAGVSVRTLDTYTQRMEVSGLLRAVCER